MDTSSDECDAEARRRMSRERWSAAVSSITLELINPPESSRTYSDGYTGGAALSLLGSKGEWKVASNNHSRWLTLSLGGVRCVQAIVVQSGSLQHSFSGWVQQLRVAYSCDDELPHPKSDGEGATEGALDRAALSEKTGAADQGGGWIDCGRDLITNALSDPTVEHRVFLREPVRRPIIVIGSMCRMVASHICLPARAGARPALDPATSGL